LEFTGRCGKADDRVAIHAHADRLVTATDDTSPRIHLGVGKLRAREGSFVLPIDLVRHGEGAVAPHVVEWGETVGCRRLRHAWCSVLERPSEVLVDANLRAAPVRRLEVLSNT